VNKFLERLETGKVMVADGATGTNLQAVGLAGGTHTEDWVFDHPEKLLDLEKAFVAAGSDIVLTCTFGGTRLRMKGAKYGDQVLQINQHAATLAREAAGTGKNVLVGGSIGPLGQLLKPYGPLSIEEAKSAFAEQVQGLADGGVDVLVIETQFSYDEVDAAFTGARSVSDLPIVVSFSYDRGLRTMMGVKPMQVIKKYKAMGAVMVGANCGTTLENMESILKEYAEAEPHFPLWAKPNAGMPRLSEGKTFYDITPEQMAEMAKKYVEASAQVVGGCCGSTPEHIAAIARAVK